MAEPTAEGLAEMAAEHMFLGGTLQRYQDERQRHEHRDSLNVEGQSKNFALRHRSIGQLEDAVSRQPHRGKKSDRAQRLGTLMERELDMERAIARGLSNSQIAAARFIGIATVKTHVQRSEG